MFLKGALLHALNSNKEKFGIGFIKDFGPYTETPVDYPDFAHVLGESIHLGVYDMGIAICGSGVGMSMVTNKYPKVRAALCWNSEIARLSREHNNANVLCIPARFLKEKEVLEMIHTFLTTSPSVEERHTRRVKKISISKTQSTEKEETFLTSSEAIPAKLCIRCGKESACGKKCWTECGGLSNSSNSYWKRE